MVFWWLGAGVLEEPVAAVFMVQNLIIFCSKDGDITLI
jgi:hypothetical protein